MAREAEKSTTSASHKPANVEWAESAGLLWDRMTPQEVAAYLVDRRGLSAGEAAAHVDSLRGTEAGSLMLWN
ncbi:hypothetical protein [Mycobacterium sp. IS-1590]|uniref:hypothetical protein n=1 Tax=Mycobacterium sp. IS-1590 TaxID=1772286 RepID=UPI000A7A71BF|nr:hypothetical protein [Mycobacterium sp. IS-1590]